MKVADMEKVSAFQGLVASHYRDYYATLNIGYIYMFMLVLYVTLAAGKGHSNSAIRPQKKFSFTQLPPIQTSLDICL
jgi:hypothetical protein